MPSMGAVNLLHRLGIGCQMAVVDDVGRERGLLQRYIERVASAHAPADCANTILLHIRLRGEKFKGRMQDRAWPGLPGRPA